MKMRLKLLFAKGCGQVYFGALGGPCMSIRSHFLVLVSTLLLTGVFPTSGTFAEAARASVPAGQAELVAAQEAGRGANFIEVTGVKVVRLLKDDLMGSKHQKWVVELANGREVAAVYNIDVTPRVPLKVGDVVSMGGQYIYDRGGGLLHWLHEDRRGRRPNGYVELNGVRYGASGRTGIYTN